ncbi:MAG: hypothetical protein LBF72_01155 [Holosporales bacterium]|nr:hypothetical protein [Holosporales bacterium]
MFLCSDSKIRGVLEGLGAGEVAELGKCGGDVRAIACTLVGIVGCEPKDLVSAVKAMTVGKYKELVGKRLALLRRPLVEPGPRVLEPELRRSPDKEHDGGRQFATLNFIPLTAIANFKDQNVERVKFLSGLFPSYWGGGGPYVWLYNKILEMQKQTLLDGTDAFVWFLQVFDFLELVFSRGCKSMHCDWVGFDHPGLSVLNIICSKIGKTGVLAKMLQDRFNTSWGKGGHFEEFGGMIGFAGSVSKKDNEKLRRKHNSPFFGSKQ